MHNFIVFDISNSNGGGGGGGGGIRGGAFFQNVRYFFRKIVR